MSQSPPPTSSPIPQRELHQIPRTRRHPRPWQSEYLHLRHLVCDLEAALRSLDGSVRDVLDVYCGSRPYEDLLPPGSRCVGMDVTDRYGVADVVTDEFLPFRDESFDLVLCTQAFQFVSDPRVAVREFQRVLRPSGAVLMTVPHVWEYDRAVLEHRFTEPSLAALFQGWNDVRVVENGGRAVTWATATGRMLSMAEGSVRQRSPLGRLGRPAFGLAYLLVNLLGRSLDRLERRMVHGSITLPPNLLLTARRPDDA